MADQILNELSEIKAILKTHVALTEARFVKNEEKIYEHSVEIWGKNGTPGLSKDVDRLKTVAGTFKWQISAIVGLLGERIWAIFGKH